MPPCIKNKVHTRKYMRTLLVKPFGEDITAVVRWCNICGAIVIDQEYDNRICGKFQEIEFPELLKSAIEKGD